MVTKNTNVEEPVADPASTTPDMPLLWDTQLARNVVETNAALPAIAASTTRGWLNSRALTAFVLDVAATTADAYAALNRLFDTVADATYAALGVPAAGLKSVMLRNLRTYEPQFSAPFQMAPTASNDGLVFTQPGGPAAFTLRGLSPEGMQIFQSATTPLDQLFAFQSCFLSQLDPRLLYSYLFDNLLLQYANPALSTLEAKAKRIRNAAVDWLIGDEKKNTVGYVYQTKSLWVSSACTIGSVLSGGFVALARRVLRELASYKKVRAELLPEEKSLYDAIGTATSATLALFYRPKVAPFSAWFRPPVPNQAHTELAFLLNSLELQAPLHFADLADHVGSTYVQIDLPKEEKSWKSKLGIPAMLYDRIMPAALRYALDVSVLSALLHSDKGKLLVKRLEDMDAAIQLGEVELNELVAGLQDRVQEQLKIIRRQHQPPREWMERPEMTGYLRLSAETVARLEQGMRDMHRYVPALQDVTLQDLTEGGIPISTGLPGAFANFVASLQAQGRLSHPHQYNSGMQHKEVLARRQASMTELRTFRYDRTRARPEDRVSRVAPQQGGAPSFWTL